MRHLESILTQPVCQALGWALLHFLWQGTLVALAMAGGNLTLRNSPARIRYAMGCLCLVLLLALPVLTLAITFSRTAATPAAIGWRGAAAATIPLANTGLVPRPGLQRSLAPLLPWIVAVWMSGVLLLSTRWFGAWTCLRELRRSVSLPVPAEWRRTLEDLRRRAAISAPVRLCVTGLTQVPCVLGWLRPVILMPAAAVTGLDHQALEALLAHELAHIRRHDYLVNLLQTLADTLLFYHPAVWWVSRRIRIERENCCDDIAAEICGDRLIYARTLVDLEQLQASHTAFALSASGGSLLHRIQRLVSGAGTTERPGAAWPSLATVVALIGCVLASLHPALRASASSQPLARNHPQIRTALPGEPALVSVAARRAAPGQAPWAIAMASPAPQTSATAAAPADPPGKSQDFLTGIVAAGFRHLTVEELIDLRVHGVTPEFALGVKQAGFVSVTAAELVNLRIHGVALEFMRDLSAAGYSNLSIDDLVRLRNHGVDADFIRHLDKNGMHNLSVDQLVRLRQAGI